MRGPTWWRFRLRTLLIVVMLVALLFGGLRALERQGRYVRNQGQVRAWTGQRNKYRQLSELARSKGDIADATKWDELAEYADGLRRVYEHAAQGGPGPAPPMPKNPEWPPVRKQPQ
jgi:hypothetical protein